MRNHAIDQLFEQHKDILGRRELSRFIRAQMGRDQNIAIPLEEAADIYESLDPVVSDISQLRRFLDAGLERIRKLRVDQRDVFIMNPNCASQLATLLTQEGFIHPSWLPETFREESTGNTRHAFTYFFDWSTVDPLRIHHQEQGSIEMGIRRYLVSEGLDTSQNKPYSTALGENKTLQTLSKTLSQKKDNTPTPVSTATVTPIESPKPVVQTAPTSQPQEPAKPVECALNTTLDLSKVGGELNERTLHSLLATQIYSQKFNQAMTQNVPFSLTIEEASEILRTASCHFTDAPLSKALADLNAPNGITLTTLLPEKGFVLGNIVACSNHVNGLKGTMPGAKFEQTMTALKTLSGSGMGLDDISKLLSA